MLKIENLKVSVGKKQIIKGLNLEIPYHELHVIFGPNGSGKSTLAYAIMGLPSYKINSGKIIYDKRNITKLPLNKRAKLGIFLAYQNPPEIKGIKLKDFFRILNPKINFKQILKRSYLEDFGERELNVGFSGGEKKRSEIAQIFALNPKFIILDEPDSGVDIENLELLGKEISSFIKEKKITGLVITHHGYILKYLKPKKAHVMLDGKIVCSGDYKDVIKTIRKYGYERCKKCKI